MARVNQIVCDRCGKAENMPEIEGDGTDIAQTYVTVARRRAGVPIVLDMCTDCCTFVAEAMKMAVLPTTPEHRARFPVNDDAAIKRTPVYGHPTYQACGCYVTDHLPGRCPIPPGARNQAPSGMFPCQMANCESPRACNEARRCRG